MSKRKYNEVKGYWVYSIKIKSNGKYYIGVSKCKKCWQRFSRNKYKTTALEPYLEEFDSMEKTVLVDSLSKEDAYIYEGNIIRALQMNNLCVNEQRSGLIRASDVNAYNKQYYEKNKERKKQYYEKNKEKILKSNKERYERKKNNNK